MASSPPPPSPLLSLHTAALSSSSLPRSPPPRLMTDKSGARQPAPWRALPHDGGSSRRHLHRRPRVTPPLSPNMTPVPLSADCYVRVPFPFPRAPLSWAPPPVSESSLSRDWFPLLNVPVSFRVLHSIEVHRAPLFPCASAGSGPVVRPSHCVVPSAGDTGFHGLSWAAAHTSAFLLLPILFFPSSEL
ncbi:hypothetical protein BS78_01G182500 [Paspalum vaginatum]|nr:hypothetical protein BS78_01G182500 [Paspalum vaginatum]